MKADDAGHKTGLEVVGFCHVQSCDFACDSTVLALFVGNPMPEVSTDEEAFIGHEVLTA